MSLTTLDGDLNSSDVEFSVNDAVTQALPFYVLIENELIHVSELEAEDWETTVRGAHETTAAAHVDTTPIYLITAVVPVAGGINCLYIDDDGKQVSKFIQTYSQNGGSNTVQQVTVSLSSAQLLSLFSSPVTLVPAPGAGKAIQVLGVFGIFEAGETPYVDGDGEKIAYATDLFDPVADSPWDMTNPDSNGGPAAGKSEQEFDPSVWLNADVVIGCPTTDPTEGDGTALIVVTFTVIDFT